MDIGVGAKKISVAPSPEILTFDLLSLPWDDWSFRQRNYIHHAETKTVPFVWRDIHVHQAEIEEFNHDLDIYPHIMCEVKKVEEFFGAKANRVMLASLRAGGQVYEHYDPPCLQRVHRLHLPIQTNQKCLFSFDGKPFHLERGVWHEINSTALHSVANKGESDRIHLMIDVDPNCLI